MELAPDERAVVERAVRLGLVQQDPLRQALALRVQLAARGRRVPVEAVVEALAPSAPGRPPGPDARLVRQLLAAGPSWERALEQLGPRGPQAEDVTPTVGGPAPGAPAAPTRAHDVLAAAAQASAAAFQLDPRFAPLAALALEPLGELGRGGMGVVLRVRDRRLDRLAALKLLHDAGDPRVVQRFIREAEVTARLDHPAIPPVYEAGVDAQGRHYLLMRLVGGEPLGKRIKAWHAAGHPPGAVARELVEALARVGEAVAYAHGRAVIHRDLKPQNVMVGEFGEVLVMDWGLAALDPAERAALAGAARTAAAPAPDGEPLTVQGSVLGTPGYMPPEQAAGEELDARADVFALGAMLCELLTGRPPIAGETSLEKILQTVQGKVARPSALRPGVPAELDDLAARALAPDPASRLPSAADFVRELRAWLAGDDLASHRYGAGERALRAVRRRPARAVSLAALALLLVVAGGAAAQVREAARRATDEARGRAVDEAQADSQRARAAFEVADVGSRTGLALAAVQAAQRWHDLARTPGSAEARAAAAGALAAVASASQQWDLAVEAHRLALGLGRDEAVAAAVAAVTSARTAEAREHLARAAAFVDQARRGVLGGQDALEDAVVLASRWREPAVVRALVVELDRLTSALRAARREALLSLAEPLPDEARAGEARLEGLGEALRALDEAPRPLEPTGPVRSALERLARREAARSGRESRGAGWARALVAAEQLQAARHEQLARLLCELLGRLGDDAAAPGLARFLRAEEDAGRCALALVALCRLDTPASLAEALRARQGWDARSALGLRTLELLQRTTAWPALEAGHPDGLRLRAELRSLRAAAGEDGLSDYDRAVAARPDDPATLRGRAVARLRAGDPTAARADAQRAVDLAPEEPLGWALLGELQGRRGDAAGAERSFERAIALDPDRAAGWQARGLTRDQRGDVAAAALDYARAVELDPGLALCWERLVVLATALGELEDARSRADAAVQAVPSHGPVWRARAELRLLAHDGAGARSDADEAVRRSPGDPGAWVVRATARLRTGDLGGAWLDVGRALGLAPGDPRGWWCQVECLSAAGRHPEAAQAAERLVAIDGAYPEAWDLLARTRLRAGDARGSLAAAERGIVVAPRTPGPLVARARALHRLGDRAGAEAACDRALALDPACVEAWLARGEARFAGGRPGADADVERAVALSPDHIEARRTRAALRAARDDLAGALLDLDHAAEVAPDDLEVLSARGRLRYVRGDLAGARDDLSRLLTVRPRDPDALTYRGLARLGLADLEGARADLDLAVQEAPASRVARAGRCAVRERLGDLEGSIADVDAALEVAPDDAALHALRARLLVESRGR